MADTPIANPFDGLTSLLAPILGSSTTGTDQQSLTTEQQLQQLLTMLTQQTQNTSGTTAQTTGGTSTNTISNNANIDALQKVFAQQQAGVTPEMLAAIFKEGAKAVPQLVSTTANAVGARPSGNSSLATSLDSLNSNLVNQAAVLNQNMLKDSATTAAQIADLTKQQTNTGATTGTNQISTEQLLQNLLNQTQSTSGTTNTEQQKRDDSTSTTGINATQTGIAAGLAGITGLLTSSGVPQDIINQISGLLSPTIGSPTYNPVTNPANPSQDSNPDLNGSPFDQTPISNPAPLPPVDDYSGGFADGGIVPQPKLLQITDAKTGGPNAAQLLSLLGGRSNILGGSSGSSNSTGPGATAGGVDLVSMLLNGGGEGAASSGGVSAAPSSDNGFGSPVGISIGAPSGQAIGMAGLNGLVGNPIGALMGVIGSIIGNSSLNSNQSTVNAPANVDLSPVDVNSLSQSDTIGGLVGADSLSPDAAAIGAADSDADANGSVGDASGDSGDSGDGGDGDGGDGGGGWADGGIIPKQKRLDPLGVKDKLMIPVSGGEAIMPTDVVDMLSPDFFNNLIALYHKPAATQRGVNNG